MFRVLGGYVREDFAEKSSETGCLGGGGGVGEAGGVSMTAACHVPSVLCHVVK